MRTLDMTKPNNRYDPIDSAAAKMIHHITASFHRVQTHNIRPVIRLQTEMVVSGNAEAYNAPAGTRKIRIATSTASFLTGLRIIAIGRKST